tara:strand:- start:42855 stop:43289 length:435 start_codon:yes stop_codon:yes gene_type:complete
MTTMEQGHPPRLHFFLRCTFFVMAGAVAGLVLAGMSIQRWSIEWRLVMVLAALGALSAIADVLIYEGQQWSIPKACLAWSAGFFFLTCLMAVFLVIPYAILAGISKFFGVWEAWENLSHLWATLIPFCVGSIFAYGGWRLLDDY